ncbi:hypothetical protein EMIHUDRAFT_455458 [Emiliania huxleyi CCMP1516]|uniref:Nucleotide-diphospho-sugar transferase domain-containing protein n=2 Tax=Emiliania huxleyi TaxID=2903 RepID=A0A0D3KGY1_EMIH1|nr:hypothetical protein EMIHUDRAFT_455458 [Emiliania huxleyi CCMP1516]EOD35016.1 hypothetical protein EMIHUDRAFT_455458 [Emiliania huxleyi CCMP1516]|eukprot:XP_005787445.1 hypothetical protein EMIHUDRAFT_455458 [Emiliania huxleyi CCMP1516]
MLGEKRNFGIPRQRMWNSAGRLPPFTAFGTDLEAEGALARVASQLAYQRELIIVCSDAAPTASASNALNTVLQLRALGLHHVLFLSDSPASCLSMRGALPDIACVWSSRLPKTMPANPGLCAKMYWGYAFYFYDLRKHYAARLAIEFGVNVLQTDTDVVWLSNPYPTLKGIYRGVQLVSMSDTPLVNAGVFYAQDVRPGDGAAWVLRELSRRLHLFITNSSAVKQYVPWAQPPYFANIDEQTLMNDVLRSSIANVTSYAQAPWKETAEYALLNFLGKEVGSPRPARAWLSIAPLWLFMPFPSSFSAREIRTCERNGTMGVDGAGAAPSLSGAWSRRAILRAHGWWEAGADRLLSAYYGWANRTSRLAVAEPAGEVRNGSCAAPLERGGAHRALLGTCGWMPPRACYRLHYSTAAELVDAKGSHAAELPRCSSFLSGIAGLLGRAPVAGGRRLEEEVPTLSQLTRLRDAASDDLARARAQLRAAQNGPERRQQRHHEHAHVLRRRLREAACDGGGVLHLLPPPSDEREELLALLRSTALLRHPVRQLPPLLANVRSALGVPASWGNAERQRDEYVAEWVEALYGPQILSPALSIVSVVWVLVASACSCSWWRVAWAAWM